eukprot:evm.model.scf_1984EXC.1 EVM.evm.TU.scf_1984EXC.1   scf_1984EXC:13177-21382(-)
MAATGDGSALAVGREGGAIEVWDAEAHRWNCCLVIPGRDEASLSSLVWVRDSSDGSWRLFSSGLDGNLCEWDLVNRQPSHTMDSYGGAIWALAVAPEAPDDEGGESHLALACDSGSVQIFCVESGSGGAYLKRTCTGGSGRALCVCWHPEGHSIVAGHSGGTVHVWDWKTGRETLCLRCGPGPRGTKLAVWSVLALPGHTLVTGDSSGRVVFWDGRFGTQVKSFKIHEADVMAMAGSADGRSVFASGADVQIALFRQMDQRQGGWTFIESRRPHSHDVRSLITTGGGDTKFEERLVSGSQDARVLQIAVTRFNKANPTALTVAPEAPIICTAAQGKGDDQVNLMLTASGRQLDLWRLARPVRLGKRWRCSEGDAVDVAAVPAHLARIDAAGPWHIACAALAPDGRLLAISDCKRTRVMQIDGDCGWDQGMGEGGSKVVVKRCRVEGKLPSADRVVFVPGSDLVAIATRTGSVLLVDLDEGAVVGTMALQEAPRPKISMPLASRTIPRGVQAFKASPNGRWIAAAIGLRVQ